MARGGVRSGAGRKTGAVTQRSRDIANGVIEDTGETPLEFMLKIMRDDQATRAERLDMAKAAAPYVHARLSSVDAKVQGDMGMTVEIVRFGTTEG